MDEPWEIARALELAFRQHRTSTHQLGSTACLTCQESDRALEAFAKAYKKWTTSKRD